MIVLITAIALAAEPMAGAVVRPFSRADLVWVDENRTSGEGVGEFDGVVRPAVQPFVGAWFGRVGLIGTLGVARLSTRTFVGDTVSRREHTTIRPGAEFRWALRPESPRVWTAATAHVTIPSATDRSTAYTEEEQEAANDAARNTRARLGGFGGSIGVGAEVDVHPSLALGVQWSLSAHRGSLRSTTAVSRSTWLASDAGFVVTIRWPKRPQVDDEADASP